MATDVQQFWKLLAQSKLYPQDRLRQFMETARPLSSELTTAKLLAKWLVEKSAITRYHASILLAGRAGPFVFGDYVVTGKTADLDHPNLFSGRHRPTGHPVILEFLNEQQLDESTPKNLEQLTATIGGCSQLDHPALSRCYELIKLPEYKFTALESPTGPTLAKQLGGNGKPRRLPPVNTLQMISSLADGLGQLHQIGLAHGEVSPDTITIRNAARLNIRPVGHYQAAGDSRIDDLQSRDVRDLGHVAASMLLGEPFDLVADSPVESLVSRLGNVEGMNQSAVRLVTRMIAAPPDQFSTVVEARDAINRLLPATDPPVYQSHKTTSRYLAALQQKENALSVAAASQLSEIGESSKPVAETPSIAAPDASVIRRPRNNRLFNVALIATPIVLIAVALGSLLRTPAPGPISEGGGGNVANANSSASSNGNLKGKFAETASTRIFPSDDGRSLWACLLYTSPSPRDRG